MAATSCWPARWPGPVRSPASGSAEFWDGRGRGPQKVLPPPPGPESGAGGVTRPEIRAETFGPRAPEAATSWSLRAPGCRSPGAGAARGKVCPRPRPAHLDPFALYLQRLHREVHADGAALALREGSRLEALHHARLAHARVAHQHQLEQEVVLLVRVPRPGHHHGSARSSPPGFWRRGARATPERVRPLTAPPPRPGPPEAAGSAPPASPGPARPVPAHRVRSARSSARVRPARRCLSSGSFPQPVRAGPERASFPPDPAPSTGRFPRLWSGPRPERASFPQDSPDSALGTLTPPPGRDFLSFAPYPAPSARSFPQHQPGRPSAL